MRNITSGYKMARTAILLGLISIASQLSGCALLYRDLQPPTAELVAIQPEGLQNDLSLALLTRLRITNPNSVALPIEGGRLEIDLNGEPVANSTLSEDFTVPANSSTDIDIRINVNLAAGLAIGLGILNSQQADVAWQLSGYVDVGMQYLGRVNIRESGVLQLAPKRAISN
jgi:LEA14-like dessication related protein